MYMYAKLKMFLSSTTMICLCLAVYPHLSGLTTLIFIPAIVTDAMIHN